MIESEERVKKRDDGAKRYKVYYFPSQKKPLEKKGDYSDNSVQQVSNPYPEGEYLLDNLNPSDSLSSRSENLSSRSQTLTQRENDLPDDLLDNLRPETSVQQVVQQVKPCLISDSDLLDNNKGETQEANAHTQTQQPQLTGSLVTPSIGDTVRDPDGQFGVAEMVYPDGQIGVAYDGGCKEAMWKSSELTVVDKTPVPQPDPELAPAKQLKPGMWVRCADEFYGHLGAQATDGRWYVLRPKSRKVDAESRLYAATEITPMPTQ